MSSSFYIKSFFEKGRIVINDKTKNMSQRERLFRSVLLQLQTEHNKFMEECTRENILKIDHQNLIIEVVL